MIERPIQTLSATSDVYLVEISDGGLECRKCILLARDGTQTRQLSGPTEALDHLDEHVKRAGTVGNPGASEAIRKLEACSACGGKGTVRRLPGAIGERCASCSGTGKNELGRKRKV